LGRAYHFAGTSAADVLLVWLGLLDNFIEGGAVGRG
jgi:hypothetical protein